MLSIFKKNREAQPLFFHTDIHCHVLPALDDGSPDIETSLRLVDRMASWGLKRIIASPHVTDSTFPNNPSTVAPALDKLRKALAQAGADVQLANSAEYRVDDLFARHRADGILMPLPGNYLLIENSFMQEPWNIDQVIFDLQVDGFRPILAHPERYSYYWDNKARYKALHAAGANFQINLLSLAGHYGKDEKKIAEMLIDEGLVDFIGTDIHRDAHLESIDRYLASKDYLRHRSALQPVLKNDII